MIVVRLMGGLGNQMFQYALAYVLSKKYNTSLKVDLTLLNDRSQPHEVVTHRTLLLDQVFNIRIEYADRKAIEYFNGKVYSSFIGKIYNRFNLMIRQPNLKIEKSRSFDPHFLEAGENACIVGSFQSEQYFISHSSAIKQLYQFKNHLLTQSHDLAMQINNSQSVAIHVRRGDYVTSKMYRHTIGTLPISYYEKAIAEITKRVTNPVFYIFSDDIEWCSKELAHLPVSLVWVGAEHSGLHAANHLQLLTLCKHFIISNSTFAWWGAWLSNHTEKVVIAPQQWFKKEAYNTNSIVPTSWVKV
jgi:hypothetical protein